MFSFSNNCMLMKQLLAVIVFSGLLLTTEGIECNSSPFRSRCADGEAIVKVASSSPDAASMAVQNLNAQVVPVADKLHLIRSTDGSSTKQLLKMLRNSAGIEQAYPNLAYRPTGSVTSYPNDPLFNQQWNLPIIKALEAWAVFNGSQSVLVGVIDAGVDVFHPDLIAHIHPVLRLNGADNCTNAKCPNKTNVTDASPEGHGTHSAGIIGAVVNNSAGIAGVCPKVTLVPCKIARDDGMFYEDAILRCFDFMIKNNVTVVSNSYGNDVFSKPIWDGLKSLDKAGVLMVWAAGNDGNSLDTNVFQVIPPSWPHSNLLTVAATGSDDNLTIYSNYGSLSIDVAAPGDNITSTIPNGKYTQLYGTSMSCPHVAGLAALVQAYRPALCGRRIKQVIMDAVDKLPKLAGRVGSGGRINMLNTLVTAKTANGTCPPSNADSIQPPMGNQLEATLLWFDKSGAILNGVDLVWKMVNDGCYRINLNGRHYGPGANKTMSIMFSIQCLTWLSDGFPCAPWTSSAILFGFTSLIDGDGGSIVPLAFMYSVPQMMCQNSTCQGPPLDLTGTPFANKIQAFQMCFFANRELSLTAAEDLTTIGGVKVERLVPLH